MFFSGLYKHISKYTCLLIFRASLVKTIIAHKMSNPAKHLISKIGTNYHPKYFNRPIIKCLKCYERRSKYLNDGHLVQYRVCSIKKSFNEVFDFWDIPANNFDV